MAIARNFFTLAENIPLVLVFAIALALSTDFVSSADRIAVRVAVAGEIVLVVAGFALAFVEEAGLVAAALFLAALSLVASSKERINAAVADKAAVSVETDAVDITSVRLFGALVDVFAFKRVRSCNCAIAIFADAFSVDISLFTWANLLAVLSAAFVAFFAETLVAAFRVAADCIFIALVELVAALISIAAGLASSVVTFKTLAFKRNSVCFNIHVDTLRVLAAHVLLFTLIYISTGDLSVGELNRCAARSTEALVASLKIHAVHVVSAANGAAFIYVSTDAVDQLVSIRASTNAIRNAFS